jgi:hypothetical protein
MELIIESVGQDSANVSAIWEMNSKTVAITVTDHRGNTTKVIVSKEAIKSLAKAL